MATYNFDYTLDVGYALHSYNHRTEDAFLRFSVSGQSTGDFITASGLPPSRYSDYDPIVDPNCVGNLYQSDQFGFVARRMASNNNVAVCGDVHWPPNIPGPWYPGPNEYDYDNTTNVSSRCTNWQWDPAVQPQTLNCNAWGCNQRGFMIWWMQNVPGVENNNRDRNNQFHPIWWDHLWYGNDSPF